MSTDVVTVSRRQTAFRSMLAGILLYSIAVIFHGYVPISGFVR